MTPIVSSPRIKWKHQFAAVLPNGGDTNVYPVSPPVVADVTKPDRQVTN